VLSWEDICYTVRVGGAGQLRQILSDVSGIAGTPGSLDSSDAAQPATNGSINGDRHSSMLDDSGDISRSSMLKGSGGGGGGGMCAILGPSGAGKTTLLDILAGRRYGAGEHQQHQVALAVVTGAAEYAADLSPAPWWFARAMVCGGCMRGVTRCGWAWCRRHRRHQAVRTAGQP
jgi:hypothetical protein